MLNVAKRAAKDDASSSSEDEDQNGQGSEANPSVLSAEQKAALKRRRQEARELGRKKAKMMELQYWLEFVDTKHRHGSNLRKYHQHWKSQDTQDNFFYWLDHGDGKHLDLEECSRERLDRQQVRYLTREERQHYLVQVDEQGQLLWAKNGNKVWTKDECKLLRPRGLSQAADLPQLLTFSPAFNANASADTCAEQGLILEDVFEPY